MMYFLTMLFKSFIMTLKISLGVVLFLLATTALGFLCNRFPYCIAIFPFLFIWFVVYSDMSIREEPKE